MYRYNSYWDTWNRVLCQNHPKGPFVEITLTPIPSYESTWEDIKKISIRFHGTVPNKKDKFTEELPAEVRAEMEKHLGVDLVNRLLTEDFLS